MQYESLLKKVASRSLHPTSFHAAIILKHGKPSAIGTNGAGKHAEEQALRKLRGDAAGGILISVRLRRDGRWGMARPCPKCQKLLAKAKLKAVYWSDAEGELRSEAL